MSFTVRKAGLSSLPLGLVPAAVMDTETTGLKVASDRVIEIAAIRIEDGKVDETGAFQRLVNPQQPIPAASTAIHNITDDDVAGAEDFKTVMQAFANWAGNAVIVGYSLGFDLGILKTEHERHGLKWIPPRSLDVRDLVAVLSPNLPDESLDTVAGWLGVEVHDRHRALGDARLTLEVFRKLLPKLNTKGIATLSQAERACLQVASGRGGEAQLGWHDVVQAGRNIPTDVSDYARIDSYPYRHRVRDAMNSPPLIVDGNVTIREALAKIISRKVSSIFTGPGDSGTYGILTERDILRVVNRKGANGLELPVRDVAVAPLISVGEKEFVYRAITQMSSGGFRHLGVIDERGALVGALSARDLLKQRAGAAISLGENIDEASTPQELGKVWAGLTTIVRSLVAEEVDPRDIAAVVSRELRALTARACILAEQEMEASGRGLPPVPYAMFVLGSGGRGESLLAMDQDNAIIFTKGEPDGPEDRWFEELGRRVSDMLNEAGVRYCEGGIMASNSQWRMNGEYWRATVSNWLSKSRPEDILNCDIFFDAAAVHGETSLVDELRMQALTAASGARDFLRAMEMRAGDFQSAFGWLGRLKLVDGRIDLKMTGLMPLFSAARIMALRHGIAKRTTPSRLLAVVEAGNAGSHVVDDLIEAHRILLGAILMQQLRDIEAGLKLGNKVDPQQLDTYHLQQMKWALGQVIKIRDLLGMPTL
jgi:DNA polymerase-3 subunit epsilon/CBS domain-containing protein